MLIADIDSPRYSVIQVNPQNLISLSQSLRPMKADFRAPDSLRKRVFQPGALVSYSSTQSEQDNRGAAFIDRILRGANPAELPIEQPTKFELIINLQTAKALGVAVPQSLLLRADEVIE